jgi:hypothetical protein
MDRSVIEQAALDGKFDVTTTARSDEVRDQVCNDPAQEARTDDRLAVLGTIRIRPARGPSRCGLGD